MMRNVLIATSAGFETATNANLMPGLSIAVEVLNGIHQTVQQVPQVKRTDCAQLEAQCFEVLNSIQRHAENQPHAATEALARTTLTLHDIKAQMKKWGKYDEGKARVKVDKISEKLITFTNALNHCLSNLNVKSEQAPTLQILQSHHPIPTGSLLGYQEDYEYQERLAELLGEIWNECSNLKVMKNSWKRMHAYCTDVLSTLRVSEAEQHLGNVAADFERLFGQLLDRLRQSTVTKLKSIIRRSQIDDMLKQSLSDLISLVERHALSIRPPHTRWRSDLNAAQLRDDEGFRTMFLEVMQDKEQLVIALTYSSVEINYLVDILHEQADLYPDQKDMLKKVAEALVVSPVTADVIGSDSMISTLRPRRTSPADLTGIVHKLGDLPFRGAAYNDIFLCDTKTFGKVAVKVLREYPVLHHPHSRQMIKDEVNVWSKLNHIHVLPLYGYTENFGPLPSLVSPFCENGSVMDFLKIHPNTNRLRICSDIAQGLRYIHGLGIIHGGVKGANILIDDSYRPRITDPGMAHFFRTVEDAASEVSVRTPRAIRWMSPELLMSSDDDKSSPLLTMESDIYAFSMTMIEIFSGRKPFPHLARDVTVIADLFRGGGHHPRPGPEATDRGLNDEVWMLIERGSSHSPQERPSMSEMAARLERLEDNFTPTVRRLSPSPEVDSGRPRNLSAEIRKLSPTDSPCARGGYCEIYLGIWEGKHKVALRVFMPHCTSPEEARKNFLKEVRLWSQLKHPNILELLGTCDHGGFKQYMVCQWHPNGNASKFFKAHPTDPGRLRVLYEISQALLYLHTKRPRKVIHGDIKPANILISEDGTALLSDFGLSRHAHELTTRKQRGDGSYAYMAPELISDLGSSDEREIPIKTTASDVFAFGRTTFEILGGEPPFGAKIVEEQLMIKVVLGKRPQRPSGTVAQEWLTEELWLFVEHLTHPMRSNRPSMQEVVSELHILDRQRHLGITRSQVDIRTALGFDSSEPEELEETDRISRVRFVEPT